jgi:hypothetical protein
VQPFPYNRGSWSGAWVRARLEKSRPTRGAGRAWPEPASCAARGRVGGAGGHDEKRHQHARASGLAMAHICVTTTIGGGSYMLELLYVIKM